MKVVILAGASSIHTIRWANGLSAAGIDVHVISQHPEIEALNENVHLHLLPFHGYLGYFTIVPQVRRLLKKIKPDLLNVHYASGYGTTARLVGYSPWLLSVWGSDVYDFPEKSFVHKWLVRKNLLSADAVASTSNCMAEQVRTIVPELGEISITPFGVDMQSYKDKEGASFVSEKAAGELWVGTVKAMSPKYGVDTLIKAFAITRRQLMEENPKLGACLRLRLVGGGEQIDVLKKLTVSEKVAEVTSFLGPVPHSKVPSVLSDLDIYVALSRADSESFGVAVIEAGAAGCPVVVSNAGGLPEVTLDGVTGFVVPRENPTAAADAIYKLVLDFNLRVKMGRAGASHVAENYDWQTCVEIMKSLYSKVIKESKV
ncbi:glycosyltransferase [Amphritea sp. 2_MG-2023]|uniref:glycosyltransferase n=1 Tax=Amphritea TaxID=515417 RepID=UPI001C075D68|nr:MULTISPECIES: glycosyltransferase [Amphritea]MBU2964978.1 glycosyltransferase [Amphritea atlantica]MDO6419653.1 glycosyltransferase [Amphritea sp. 2_MG-2023]